jgi:hypothetical protein
VTSCSLTYRVEQFIDCQQHLTPFYDRARQRKQSHSTVQGNEDIHLDASTKLVDPSLEFEFTDIIRTPLCQRGIVSFTLKLLNNSLSDIIDIHICSLTPEYNVTWLNAEATQMGRPRYLPVSITYRPDTDASQTLSLIPAHRKEYGADRPLSLRNCSHHRRQGYFTEISFLAARMSLIS